MEVEWSGVEMTGTAMKLILEALQNSKCGERTICFRDQAIELLFELRENLKFRARTSTCTTTSVNTFLVFKGAAEEPGHGPEAPGDHGPHPEEHEGVSPVPEEYGHMDVVVGAVAELQNCQDIGKGNEDDLTWI